MPRSRWLCPLVLLILAGCSIDPGELPVPEKPPSLPGDPENPSAWDYFSHGDRIFEESPAEAAEAFYWAERRDPTWATPIFGRRLAFLVEDPKLFDRYVKGHRAVIQSPWAQQLDSLYRRALWLNPLLDRRLEGRAVLAMVRQLIRVRLMGTYHPVAVERAASSAVRRFRSGGPPHFRALLAEGRGRYREAARLYRTALEQNPEDVGLNADLARALFRTGNYEEAVRHLDIAIERLRDQDEDEFQPIYRSKAVFLHAIGLIQEARTDWDGARSAYSEAAQEDLAYWPAHVRLAELALAVGDTATAVSEMRLAAEIGPDEPAVLLRYGRLLEAVGELVAAERTFRHLTEIEPLFAAPYRRLARVLDRLDRSADAAAAYRAFVYRAHAEEEGVEEARERLEELDDGPRSP